MWEEMEEARRKALLAQRLSAQCHQLCEQSVEDDSRRRADIKNTLESRISDENFWIKELEMRLADCKKCMEEMEFLEVRLYRAATKCKQHLDVTEKCIEHRLSVCPEMEYGMILLNEECALLNETSQVLRKASASQRQRLGAMQNLCRTLEVDLQNKYGAMQKDKQSVELKRHSPNLLEQLTLKASLDGGGVGSSFTASMSTHNWKDVSNANVRFADGELAICRTLQDELNEALEKMTRDLRTHFAKVTESLSGRSEDLKQQKGDLENHLAMVDSQIQETLEAQEKLQRAIERQAQSLQLLHGQCLLQNSRPRAELFPDRVQKVLDKESREARRALETLKGQSPELEKTLRGLRRSRLELLEGIQERTTTIQMEDTKCLSIRNGMDDVRL